MKKTIFLICIGLLIGNIDFANAQEVQNVQLPINKETNLIEYTELVTVDSTMTQDELYTKAREWMALNFKSANSVIQMDDKNAGIIIGKGNIPVTGGKYLADGKIDFTLKIQVKNGRFKYWFTDFVHASYKEGYSGGHLENDKPACGNFFMLKKGWTQVKEITDTDVKSMIISIKSALGKKLSGDAKDTW